MVANPKENRMNDYWLDYIALSSAQKLVEASEKIYVGRDVQKTAYRQPFRAASTGSSNRAA